MTPLNHVHCASLCNRTHPLRKHPPFHRKFRSSKHAPERACVRGWCSGDDSRCRCHCNNAGVALTHRWRKRGASPEQPRAVMRCHRDCISMRVARAAGVKERRCMNVRAGRSGDGRYAVDAGGGHSFLTPRLSRLLPPSNRVRHTKKK